MPKPLLQRMHTLVWLSGTHVGSRSRRVEVPVCLMAMGTDLLIAFTKATKASRQCSADIWTNSNSDDDDDDGGGGGTRVWLPWLPRLLWLELEELKLAPSDDRKGANDMDGEDTTDD